MSAETAAILAAAERLTASLGGTFLRRRDADVADEIVREAEAQAITQLVLGASRRSGLRSLVGRNPIETILRRTRGIDVHVVAALDARPSPDRAD